MRKIAMLAVALTAITVVAGTHTVYAQTKHNAAKETLGIKIAQATEKKPNLSKSVEKIEPAQPTRVMVTVQSGDSLSSIAESNASTWQRIYFANETISNPDVINPGEQYRIPTADEQLTERPLPQPVVPAPVAQAAQPATQIYRAVAPSPSPVSANSAKAFIYAKESGNNPNATNSGGCYGIGQDCNGVVRNLCGADYACQDQYFTDYMSRRYGSWEAAQSFWLQNHWW